MTSVFRLGFLALSLVCVCAGSEAVVGMPEADLVAAKGAPEGKMVAGHKSIFRYSDAVVTLLDGKVASVEMRDRTQEAKEAQRLADIKAQAVAKKQAAEAPKEIVKSAPAHPPAPAPEAAKPPVRQSVQGFGYSKANALVNATSQLPENMPAVGEPVYSLHKDSANSRGEWQCILQYEAQMGAAEPAPQF